MSARETTHEAPGASQPEPDPRTFRALALDIDGTLLTTEGHVAPRTVIAVTEALARGVLVVLCTGREYSHGVNQLASELRLHLPAIVRNGAAVQDITDGRVLFQKCLPAEALRLTFEAIATTGATPMVIQGPREGDAICTLPPEQCHPAVAFYEQLWTRENTFRRVSSVHELLAMSSTTFVSGASDKGRTVALYKALPRLPGVMTISSASPPRSGEAGSAAMWTGNVAPEREHYEFAAILPECTKATALAEFATRHKIGLHQVMAIGDYHNDIEMLREVGWGVAMGQAPDDVKAAANAVTLDNAQDGCAVAIERYILGEQDGTRRSTP